MNIKCNVNFNVKEFEYFLGINNDFDDDVIFLYNRVLWLAKYFIYLKRKEQKRISFILFQKWLERFCKEYRLINTFDSNRVKKNKRAFDLIEL